jgi:hypothetical protein
MNAMNSGADDVPELPESATALFTLRTFLGLSTTDAARTLAQASRRSWERWEGGAPVPASVVALIRATLSGEPKPSGRDLVVVITLDDNDRPRAADTVEADTFVDLVDAGNGEATIRSLAVQPRTLVPYIRSTTFPVEENEHVMRRAGHWTRLADRLNEG